MRITPSFGYSLALILTSPKTFLPFLYLLVPFAILQIAQEWFLKNVLFEKTNIDKENEKNIIGNIESLKNQQKLLEELLKKELKKIICKETKYTGETIIKPIHHEEDETNIIIKPLTKRLIK